MTANFFGDNSSAAVRELYALVEKLSWVEINILLIGESGVGKEMVAEMIHALSRRKEKAFIRINCAAYPETLIDSELFGVERGAFTGADRPRAGLIEKAHNGTLLLDEVGDMPMAAQAKMLRVAEGKPFSKLGSSVEIESNVRFISATHKDIVSAIKRGEFRHDFFQRIAGAIINIPPLRARRNEIVQTAKMFLSQTETALRKKTAGFSETCINAMLNYGWPGNFRELKMNVTKAVALCEEGAMITPELMFDQAGQSDLQRDVSRPGTITIDDAVHNLASLNVAEINHKLILEALRRAGWEQKTAAKLLGMTPRALNHHISMLGITHETWKKNRKKL